MTNLIDMPRPTAVLGHLDEPVPAPPALSKQSPFYGVQRGQEIAATYRSHDTRAVVGKAIHGRGRKEILSLIFEAIDAGILKPTGAATKKPTLRLLIPEAPAKYCTKFDLTSAASRKRIKGEIWPAVLAHKDEVLGNPSKLESIVERWRRERHAARVTAAKVEEVKRHIVANTAAGQEPCIMFNVTLWPRPSDSPLGEYDYD